MTKINGKINPHRLAANAMIDLLEGVGKSMRLETHDGVIRQGRCTGVNCRNLILNGVDVDLPIEVVLNGDISDAIALSRIAKIDQE
jgi:hypothetical protein